MKCISVSASRNYDIKIGKGLLHTVGAEIAALGNAKIVCVVSDSTVWPLYGEIVENALKKSGFTPKHFIFPAGEESKNTDTYLSLIHYLSQQAVTRNDILVALGGGVVGDLTGFAAATYLRGIRFVQLPTTLLAAVDSSVGGKTAVDLPAGKNLLGAFWQPNLVLCDTNTLDTLPTDIFRDGCAEVIKYAVLFDPTLFSILQQDTLDFDRETVIARCVQWKRDVVTEDEFDTGIRMKLNLGHTIGHGIEARSQFSLSHGAAVAIGMCIISRGTHCPDSDKIVNCISAFGLPTTTDYPIDEIFQYTLSDKKRTNTSINLIVPLTIGDCKIIATPVEQVKTILQEGI